MGMGRTELIIWPYHKMERRVYLQHANATLQLYDDGDCRMDAWMTYTFYLAGEADVAETS